MEGGGGVTAANKSACVDLSLNVRPPEGNTKGNIGIPLRFGGRWVSSQRAERPSAAGERPLGRTNLSGYCGKTQQSRSAAEAPLEQQAAQTGGSEQPQLDTSARVLIRAHKHSPGLIWTE